MMSYSIKISLLVAVVLFVAIISSIAISFILATVSCREAKRLYGYDADVSISLGCMAKKDGKWVGIKQ